MDELTALVEAGPAAEEEAMLASLLKEKDQLLRERDTQVCPTASLRNRKCLLLLALAAAASLSGAEATPAPQHTRATRVPS